MGDAGFGKTNSLFNLISHQLDTEKNYLYARESYEAKYQLLINKREGTGLKHFNDSKTFIKYLNDTDDNYKILKDIIQIKTQNIDRIWWYGCWYA